MSSHTVSRTQGVLDRTSPIYVAGHRGLVGSAIWRALAGDGFTNIVGRSSSELDLRNRDAVHQFFRTERPRYVVLAAAKVGGIQANNGFPADFISENLQIQVNVMDAARKIGVERLLFLGSSCIYPKFATQPIREDALLTGHLEPTNDAYAVAKIAGITQVQAVRRQDGLRWISAMPTNLYGPGDNFSRSGSHVLPALIRRYEEAKRLNSPVVRNWGTGNVRREFMYVDDMADACLFLLDHFDADTHLNVGTGSDVSIRDLANTVASITGFKGSTEWDSTMPDGTPRKLLDVSALTELGWNAKTSLHVGIAATVEWYRSHYGTARH